MRNTLNDLNNHLFESLERLNDQELTGEKLREEISRSKAVTSIASNIISNANTQIEVAKMLNNDSGEKLPKNLMLENK